MATRIKKEKKFFRQCPKCDKQVGHTHHINRDRAEAKGKTCNSCSMKGKTHTAERIAKQAAAQRGRKASAETKKKQSFAKKIITDACIHLYGNKIEYPRHYFDKWSIKVRARDNNTCLRCNTVGSGSFIHAHHVVPKEYFSNTALEISNGVTLCAKCHKNLHINLSKITVSGTKLTPVGFQEHAARFIADGKASSQSGQTPPGYTSVFSPSVTIVKE